MALDVRKVRSLNFIKPEQSPYCSAVGMTYYSGNFAGLLSKLGAMVGINALRREQLRLREQGCLMGIGMASFVDATDGGTPKMAAATGRNLGRHDVAVVRVTPSRKVYAMC